MNSPESANLLQSHWKEKGPVNEILREAVEHVATVFTDEYTLRAPWRTDITDDIIESFADRTSVAPFDKTAVIPPAIFGEVTVENIELREPAIVPESDEEIDELAQSYDKWRNEVYFEKPYRLASFSDVETIAGALRNLKGQRVPKEAWEQSARATQADLSREVRTYEYHYANRIRNAALHYDDLPFFAKLAHKASDKYVVVQSKYPERDNMTSSFRDIIQLPVGEYGEEAAKKLAAATVDMNDLVKTGWSIQQSVDKILDDKLTDVLLKHTARTKDEKTSGVCNYANLGLRHSLAEGIYSISQVLSFFTAERHDAFATHDEYVRAILYSDAIEQFTRVIRSTYIGPASLAGLYKPNVLDVSEDGKVSLNKEQAKSFARERKEYTERVATNWKLHEEQGAEQPSMLGLPCPGAAPDGAITKLKEAFRVHY